ncbi:hypothetical protein Dimus_013636 [Dionaea muscipula]
MVKTERDSLKEELHAEGDRLKKYKNEKVSSEGVDTLAFIARPLINGVYRLALIHLNEHLSGVLEDDRWKGLNDLIEDIWFEANGAPYYIPLPKPIDARAKLVNRDNRGKDGTKDSL